MPGRSLYNMLKCFLLIFILNAAPQRFEKIWQNYKVNGAPGDSVLINSMVETIRSYHYKLHQFFLKDPEDTVRIFLATSDREYDQWTGSALPDWSGAVAFKEKRVIVIKPVTPFSYGQYTESLKHELVHLYLHNKFLPLWLEEGLAMYLSEKKITWWDHIRIGNAVAGGHIVSLSDIDQLLSFGYNKASLAYLQSLIAVDFIADHYGKQALRELIIRINTGQPLDQLLRNSLHTEYADFELAYIKYIKKKYRYMFMLQFEYLIMIFMVALVVFAYIRLRRRNKKILSGWEE